MPLSMQQTPVDVNAGINFGNILGAQLLFYLNQIDIGSGTGKARNLAKINPTIIGSYSGTVKKRPFNNLHGIQFDTTSNDFISWGNVFNYTDRITIFVLFRRDATSSGSFPMVFGKDAVAAYYLIMNGSTNKVTFNIATSGGEKGSGAPAAALALKNGDWYWAFGSYDKDAGVGNLRCDIFQLDGKLWYTIATTQTLAINIAGTSLEIARDNNRGQQDNITASIGGVFNYQLTLDQERRLVRSFIAGLKNN